MNHHCLPISFSFFRAYLGINSSRKLDAFYLGYQIIVWKCVIFFISYNWNQFITYYYYFILSAQKFLEVLRGGSIYQKSYHWKQIFESQLASWWVNQVQIGLEFKFLKGKPHVFNFGVPNL